MNTADKHCKTIRAVPKRALICALHTCLMQLKAAGPRVEVDGKTLDNAPAIACAERCMKLAGHIGFTP